MAEHIYPKSGTQSARLLAALLRGNAVGPLASWRLLGIYRTAAVVCNLNKEDWGVTKETVQRPNRFGEPCSFAQYRLPAEVIEAAGSAGQEFAANEMELIEAKARKTGAA
jgi:hypothetical protein